MGFFNSFVWGLALLICVLPMLNNFNGREGVVAFHKVNLKYQTDNIVQAAKQVYRTGYHFQPKKNWINDPNAPMYYKGFYHLFYQYNPKGAEWGNIVWAHSVSKDLINWIPLEPAIVPSKPFDKYGCWSGSATILPGNKPVIIYTGIVNNKTDPGYQVQNYAIPANYSDPYLRKWIKPDNNPIIKPTHENVSSFRDPTTAWFNNGHWKLIIGSKNNHRGIAYIYRSRNFVNWTKAKHPLHTKPDVGMWECPDFFPVSSQGTNGLDTSALGKDVRYVLKLIPRKVWLDPSGHKLLQWPVLELDSLRGQKVELRNVKLNKGDTIEVKGITVVQADVDVMFTFSSLDKAELYDPKWAKFPPENLAKSICGIKGATVQGGLGPFGLLTLASSNLEEYTPVFFRIFKITNNKHKVLLCSDATPSSLNQNEYKPSFGSFVDVDLAEKKLSLRSLIDHSVIESFAEGGKTVISSRVYPTLAIAQNAHLLVFNNGSEVVTIERLNAWSMKTAHVN